MVKAGKSHKKVDIPAKKHKTSKVNKKAKPLPKEKSHNKNKTPHKNTTGKPKNKQSKNSSEAEVSKASALKQTLLSAASGSIQNIDEIWSKLNFESTIETTSFITKLKAKLLKLKIEDTEDEELGKRKAQGLSLITSTQLERLVHLNLLLCLEGLFYENISDAKDLYKIIKSLVSPKPSKKSAKSSSKLDELFKFFLSQLVKPVSYIRDAIKKTFKLFVGEVSNEFIEMICEMMKSGNVQIEMPTEEEEEKEEDVEVDTEKGIEGIFEEPKKNNQEATLKQNFLIRACDLLEVLIKKTQDADVYIKLYQTLLTAFKSTYKAKGKGGLTGRYQALLGNITKTQVDIKPEHHEILTEIANSLAKAMTKDKNLNNSISRNLNHLIRVIHNFDHEEAEKIVIECTKKFMEDHNAKMSTNTLADIIMIIKPENRIKRTLFKYTKEGRKPSLRLEILQIIKKGLKKWEISDKEWKKLADIAKETWNEEIKQKHKNKLLTHLLAAMVIVASHVKNISSLSEDVEALKKSTNNSPQFHGFFNQLSKFKNSE
ncbi:unnamed protein product [Blepharisma stoltei]|uniref:Uncharacterized protein n=1 Tax=Blepharisma stoltei TaxID=1481888 RepID=A0AAU9IX60_9CILI|nr:unnamed protein product [Blepharisma stoltei]